MKTTALTIVATFAASLALAGCEDPTVAQRAAAQDQIDQAAESIELAANRASLDRVAAAEDLRSAGRRANSVPNATDAQQQAAAGLVATATTQAALLELARAAQLESANRASRSLALALTRVADEVNLRLEANKNAGLDANAGALAQVYSQATAQSDALAAAHRSMEAAVDASKSERDAAIEQAQELMIVAEEIRQRGLSAPRGQAMVIAQEAGDKRDEARAIQSQASASTVEANARQVELRLAAGLAASASRQAEALSQALASLKKMQSNFDLSSAQATEVISNLAETVQSLSTGSDSLTHPELTGCYERALADLDAAESSARRSGTAASAVNAVLSARARALLARGEGEFQTALLLNSLAGSPSIGSASDSLSDDANKALAKAQASTKEALEVYSLLKDALANGSGGSAATIALQVTVDRAVTTIQLPSFDIPAATSRKVATAPAAPSARNEAAPSDAGDDASSGPPCATIEALAAFISSIAKSPENALRIDECLIAQTAGGKTLRAMVFEAPKAMATLQIAMKAKFQSDNLGPLAAMAEQSIEATPSDVTDESATLSVGGARGAMPFQAVNADGGWKLDLDGTADTMGAPMMMQLSMAGKMVKGLIDSINAITAQMESGELDSSSAVQAALGEAMQELMQKMGGGAPSPEGP